MRSGAKAWAAVIQARRKSYFFVNEIFIDREHARIRTAKVSRKKNEPELARTFVRAQRTQVGQRTPPYRLHMVDHGSHGDGLPRLTLKAGRTVGDRAGALKLTKAVLSEPSS